MTTHHLSAKTVTPAMVTISRDNTIKYKNHVIGSWTKYDQCKGHATAAQWIYFVTLQNGYKRSYFHWSLIDVKQDVADNCTNCTYTTK